LGRTASVKLWLLTLTPNFEEDEEGGGEGEEEQQKQQQKQLMQVSAEV